MPARVVLLGVAFIAVSAFPLRAATIDTTPLTCCISPFGEPNTATYGQTFIAPLIETTLTSFTFWLDDSVGTIDFAAYVYAWDGYAVGSALYQSAQQSTANTSSFETFTFNTGGLSLLAGGRYVAFLSASQYFDGNEGLGNMAVGTTPYAGALGAFVYANNGSNFGLLTTPNGWDGFFPVDDAAFKAEFIDPEAVPEPMTLSLLGAGLATLASRRWSQRRV